MSFFRSDRDRLCSSYSTSLPNRFVPTKATPTPRSCPPVDILNLSSSPPRYPSPLPAIRSGSLVNLGSCAERIHKHSDLQLLPEVHRCVSSDIPNSVQQISSELGHFTSSMAKIEEKIGDVNFAVHDEKGVTVEAMLRGISAQVQQTQRTCSEAVGKQGAIIELLRSISGEILQSRNQYAECKDKLTKETSKYVRLKRDFDVLKTEHADLQRRLPEENEILRLKQQNSDLCQQLKKNEAHLEKLKDQKSKLEEECNKLKQQLESLKSTATRKQVMPAATRGTPMKTNPQREGHQALLLEYEDITTSIDGLLGELETHLGTYQAKQLMCQLFQTAFDKSKQLALQVARNQLGKLFQVISPERECRDTNLESTAHLYDKLICASLIKENATVEATYITMVNSEVCKAFVGQDLYERVKDVLIPQGRVGKEFRELSTLAWKFATISPPLIVCQPEIFNETLIDREATHWNDRLPTFSLVYTRPVVYRSYHGILGAQGYAGNAPIETGAKTNKK